MFQRLLKCITLLCLVVTATVVKAADTDIAVFLPSGEIAGGDITIALRVDVFDSSGFVLPAEQKSANAVISNGDNSAVASLINIVETPGHTFLYSAICTANCPADLYDGRIYLRNDAVNSTNFPRDSQRHTAVPEAVSIDFFGTAQTALNISLPMGITAPAGGVEVRVDVCQFDSGVLSGARACNFDFITIAENNGSVQDDFDFIEAQLQEAVFTAAMRCVSNCDGLFEGQQNISMGDNPIWDTDPSQTNLTSARVNQGLSFSLSELATVSIDVLLPNTASLTADPEVQLNLTFTAANDAALLFDSMSVMVPRDQGNLEVDLAYPVDALTRADTFRISAVCTIDCGNLLSDFLYYTPSGISEEFSQSNTAINQLPTTRVDFPLRTGSSLSGFIRLSDETDLSGSADIRLQLNHFDGNATTSFLAFDSYSLSLAAPSVPFSLVYSPKPSGFYQLSIVCDDFFNACGNIQEEMFLTLDNGLVFNISDPDTFIPVESFPESVTLNLAVGDIITGTVSVPSDANATNAALELEFERFDGVGVSLSKDVQSVSMGGALSTGFESTIAPVESGNTYRVSVRCSFTCGDLSTDVLYLSSDGSLTSTPQSLSSVPSTLVLAIPKRPTISGLLSLPNGGVATQDYPLRVELSGYNNGQFVGSSFAQVTLAQGQANVAYSIALPSNNPDTLRLTVGCSFSATNGCGPVLDGTFDGSTLVPDFLAVDSLPSVNEVGEVRNLVLYTGSEVGFRLSLPGGALGSDISVSVNITAFEDEQFSASFDRSVVVRAGQTSVQSSMAVDLNAPNQTFRIRYGCSGSNGDCGSLLATNFYTPTGPVITEPATRLSQAQLLANPVLSLRAGTELAGDLILPNPVQGFFGLSWIIRANVFDTNDQLLYETSASVRIDVDTTSAPYSLALPSLANARYQLLIFCSGDERCKEYAETFVDQNGASTIDSAAADLSLLDLQSPFDINVQTGDKVDFQLKLPDGFTGADLAGNGPFGAGFEVQALLFDAAGEKISQFTPSNFFVEIEASQSMSAIESVTIPQLPAGFSIKLAYACRNLFGGDCINLIENHYYAGVAPVFNLDDATPITNIDSTFNLPLVVGVPAQLEVRRPPSLLDIDEFLDTRIVIETLDSTENVLARQEVFAFINVDQSSVVRETSLFQTVAAGEFYRIHFECLESTDGFVSPSATDCSRYDTENPAYTLDIDPAQLANPIVLQHIAAPEPIFPDSFEPDNSPAQANEVRFNTQQQRTIHEAGDVDWVRLILNRETTVRIEATSSDATDGKPNLVLLDEAEQELERHDDVFFAEEQNELTAIIERVLIAGEYLVRVEAMSPTAENRGYQLRFSGLPDDTLCFPVKGAIICL